MSIEEEAQRTLYNVMRPSVWSIAFYLAPLYVASEAGLGFASVIIVLVIVGSILYHLAEDNGPLYVFDRTAGYLLAIVSAGLVAFGDFTYPYFAFTIIAGLASAYYYEEQRSMHIEKKWSRYEITHMLWHVFTALTALSAILTYVF